MCDVTPLLALELTCSLTWCGNLVPIVIFPRTCEDSSNSFGSSKPLTSNIKQDRLQMKSHNYTIYSYNILQAYLKRIQHACKNPFPGYRKALSTKVPLYLKIVIIIQPLSTRDDASALRRSSIPIIQSNIQQSDLQSVVTHETNQLVCLCCDRSLI
jgi:hypothetical protein